MPDFVNRHYSKNDSAACMHEISLHTIDSSTLLLADDKLLLLLLLIKNVFRVTFNRNCYKGTVHKLKS